MCSLMSGYYSHISVVDRNSVFRLQCETIRSIADNGSAIFVGRCADYVLRNHENVLNVFVTSDGEDRIRRYRERMEDSADLSDGKIADILESMDKKRCSYYDSLTFKEWGHSSSYDLCLDTARLGMDGCVEMIIKALDLIR